MLRMCELVDRIEFVTMLRVWCVACDALLVSRPTAPKRNSRAHRSIPLYGVPSFKRQGKLMASLFHWVFWRILLSDEPFGAANYTLVRAK